jgi:hypothetical protein
MQREPFAMTLYDLKEEYNWIRQLGWNDQDLMRVPVHEQATSGDDYINLTNWGGTALGVSEKSGGGTSAGIRNVRNLYVYKGEVPERLWNILFQISQQGGPSAFEQSGIFGERGEASDFPPKG